MTTDRMDADYTVGEVARMLNRSRYTVTTLARAGEIPGAYQLSPRGRWNFRAREFDTWRLALGPKSVPAEDPKGMEPPTSRSRKHHARRSVA